VARAPHLLMTLVPLFPPLSKPPQYGFLDAGRRLLWVPPPVGRRDMGEMGASSALMVSTSRTLWLASSSNPPSHGPESNFREDSPAGTLGPYRPSGVDLLLRLGHVLCRCFRVSPSQMSSFHVSPGPYSGLDVTRGRLFSSGGQVPLGLSHFLAAFFFLSHEISEEGEVLEAELPHVSGGARQS